MRIIVNWLFCLFIFLLLGSINSIPISEKEINSYQDEEYIKFSKMNNGDAVLKNEGILNDSREGIEDSIKFKKERDFKVKNDSIPTTNHSSSNTNVVDDENVLKSMKSKPSNNSSNKHEFNDENNKILNGLENKISVNTSNSNSDNGKFNSTLIYNENYGDEADKEKVNNKDSYEPCNCDEMNEIESHENEKGEIRSYNPSINDLNKEKIQNFDNNVNVDNNKNSNDNERGLMYASGVVMGAFLFFVICGIALKVKATQADKREISSPNSRTMSLDLESVDSVDLRAGDLNSILSLETMEQYSDNNEIYLVDDGNNLKNIAKIYEIKGFKEHYFNTIEIGRNNSLNSLFDVSFNENSSVRSYPYPYIK